MPRPLLLALGTVSGLFAAHTRLDVPLLAWLSLPLLISWNRSGRWWVNALVLAGVSELTVIWWMVLADLRSPALFVLGLVYVPAGVLPFLADRLAARRLGGLPLSLVYPAARVTAEFAIAHLLPVGTVYGVLGTTQSEATDLIQVASVTGVYGVSFLVAWFATAAAGLLTGMSRGSSPGRHPRAGSALLICVTMIAALSVAGAVRVALLPTGPSVRVAGVSVDDDARRVLAEGLPEVDEVSDFARLDPTVLRAVFEPGNRSLLAATEREAAAGARVVTWSESAAQVLEADLPALLAQVGRISQAHQAYVVVGLSVYLPSAPYLRDQSILVEPSGAVGWRYDKAHPIPVMEPFPAGSGRLPVRETPWGRISTVVCYDQDFPHTVRQAGHGHADILLQPTNTWRGIARIHAQNAVFRAVENGVTLVRQASRGVGNVIDPAGRTSAVTDSFKTTQATMVAQVSTQGVGTVYSRVGDLFAWGCVAGTAMVIGLSLISRHPHRAAPTGRGRRLDSLTRRR